MIDVYPTQFEAQNEFKDVIFKIDMQDASCATVTITSGVNVTEWDKISTLIRQCLVDMKLEGDNETKAP